MKKKNLIAIISIVIIIFAVILITRQKDHEPTFTFDPADTAIYYEFGAVHEEWGKYVLEIKKGGESVFNKFKNFELQKSYSFKVSEKELADILDIFSKNDFLSWQDEYTDLFIIDGGYEILKIIYGDKEKVVRLNNYDLLEFDEIMHSINSLLILKIGEDPYKN